MRTSVNVGTCVLLGIVGVALAAGAARGGIHDVKVTTDRSIDCSSIQTIARDLYRDCKTDQDKAIATWYFVRRMLFHWPHIPTWDTLDLINSYGIGLCGYQSKAYAEIAQAGGLKARTLHMPGHVLAEVWYDDDWHFFDCQVGWFAFEKGPDGQLIVASHEDIAKDPDIVLKAVDQGRASQPFFQCRVNASSSDSPANGVTYACTAKPGGSPKVPEGRLIVNLRRGESITRDWSNEGKGWVDREATKKQPGFDSLHHPCTASPIDENDPVNWPYWKPYAQQVRNAQGNLRYGFKRYYGNGRMVYEPDLAGDAWREGLAEGGVRSVTTRPAGGTGPRLQPAEPGKPASVTFVIDCPYVITDAWLNAAALRAGEADALAIWAKAAKGEWKQVWDADKTGPQTLENVSLKDLVWEQKQYYIKVEMKAARNPADAGLDSLKITTVFMNNMYALPYFMPGRNAIRVTAGEKADLKTNPLTLRYVWEEAGKERSLERRIEKLPADFTVNVSGDQMPRMKSVTLAVANGSGERRGTSGE